MDEAPTDAEALPVQKEKTRAHCFRERNKGGRHVFLLAAQGATFFLIQC
jgi:hypothetical protein